MDENETRPKLPAEMEVARVLQVQRARWKSLAVVIDQRRMTFTGGKTVLKDGPAFPPSWHLKAYEQLQQIEKLAEGSGDGMTSQDRLAKIAALVKQMKG